MDSRQLKIFGGKLSCHLPDFDLLMTFLKLRVIPHLYQSKIVQLFVTLIESMGLESPF